jgi:hypothetical protein
VSALEVACSSTVEIRKINRSIYSDLEAPTLIVKESCPPSKDSDPSIHHDNRCYGGKDDMELYGNPDTCLASEGGCQWYYIAIKRLYSITPSHPNFSECIKLTPVNVDNTQTIISYNKISPNPVDFDNPFSSSLSSTKAYLDLRFQKVTKIFFDKVSINTSARSMGFGQEPGVVTKVGITSV